VDRTRRTPFGFVFEIKREPVGAVEMWQSRQRFPRAVGREGNLLLVFLSFHPAVISTALRDLRFSVCPHAVRLAMPLISRFMACCMAIAASVSDCFRAKLSSSAMLMPGRRKLSHPGI
jgi:hypothetical protein